MNGKINRRSLLSPCNLLALCEEYLASAVPCKAQGNSLDHYFQSPLYSYPFVQDMPWEMICEEAEKRGIPVDGRSKTDVVRQLLSKAPDIG